MIFGQKFVTCLKSDQANNLKSLTGESQFPVSNWPSASRSCDVTSPSNQTSIRWACLYTECVEHVRFTGCYTMLEIVLWWT